MCVVLLKSLSTFLCERKVDKRNMALNKIAKYLLHSVAVNELPTVKQHFPLITPFRKYFLRILFKAGE